MNERNAPREALHCMPQSTHFAKMNNVIRIFASLSPSLATALALSGSVIVSVPEISNHRK